MPIYESFFDIINNVINYDDNNVFNVRLDRSLPEAASLLPRATGCLFYIKYGTAEIKLPGGECSVPAC